MDFITEEVAKDLGLTPEQISGIKPIYESHTATMKQEWDTKANTDAEKIIAGAIESTAKKFNVDLPREQGEKNADYLARLNEKVVETQKVSVSELEKEYKQKLKDFDGGDATKKELELAKSALDEAQKKLVDYDDLKVKAEKLTGLETEYSSLKERVFFQNDKPNFPDTVNKYEAKAIWDEFVSDTKEKWNISFNEKDESIAVNKENPHLTKKLSELISADEKITSLLAGRKQEGTGARGGHTIEDIDLPENPTSEEISKSINKKLDELKIPITDKERPKKFMELNRKVHEALNSKK